MFLFSRFFHSIPIHISRAIVWETMAQSLCRLHYASSPSLSRLVCVCVCVCLRVYLFIISVLKMEAICSSVTLVPTCHLPDYSPVTIAVF